MLVAPPAAHEWVDCLAIKLAEMLDSRHKNTLARFHDEKEKVNPPEQTKITIDNFLKEKIETLHNAHPSPLFREPIEKANCVCNNKPKRVVYFFLCIALAHFGLEMIFFNSINKPLKGPYSNC